jgi:hypothetical protein
MARTQTGNSATASRLRCWIIRKEGRRIAGAVDPRRSRVLVTAPWWLSHPPQCAFVSTVRVGGVWSPATNQDPR